MSRPPVSADEARKLLDGIGDTSWHRCAANDGQCSCRLIWGGRAMVAQALSCEDKTCDGDGYTVEAANRNADLLAAALDLARTVVAITEERDRLRDILNCETGKSAPSTWVRNDVDPKREGIAWYRRWEADGSEPGEEDTDQTRVAWVRHDSEADMTTWCWEIEAPTLGAFGKQIAHGENYETAYEAIEACDKCAEVEADDAAKVTK